MASFLLATRHHRERVKAAKVLARIALETGDAPMHPSDPRRAAGDPDALRGLPAVGVRGGAIPGTRPGSNLR